MLVTIEITERVFYRAELDLSEEDVQHFKLLKDRVGMGAAPSDFLCGRREIEGSEIEDVTITVHGPK